MLLVSGRAPKAALAGPHESLPLVSGEQEMIENTVNQHI